METQWQYVFPSKKRSIDPRTGRERRHHVIESGLQKAVKKAAALAKIDKQVTVILCGIVSPKEPTWCYDHVGKWHQYSRASRNYGTC